MSTLLDWFKTIAFALNDGEPDHEFTRYPLRQMVASYNAAMCLIYKYRPDLFTETEIVKLAAGRYQDTRGCCDNVLDILDQTDAEGGTIKSISGVRKTETRRRRHWNKPSCLKGKIEGNADGGYVLENATIDVNVNGRFIVDPPVPCDLDIYVRVKCVKGPCSITEASVGAEFNSGCDMAVAAWHYVLARMLSGDRFAQGTNTTMQFHYEMFFNVLGIVQRQEQWIESEKEANS